jgi:hypothetical protein
MMGEFLGSKLESGLRKAVGCSQFATSRIKFDAPQGYSRDWNSGMME